MEQPVTKFEDARSFGVEIECIGTCNNDQAAVFLSAAGLPATQASYSGSEYNKWQLKNDGSIQRQRGYVGFEIVSPKLRGAAGYQQLKTALQCLKAQADIRVNKSCGVHVHINVKDVSLDGLKAICQNLLKYEEGLDLVLPPSRRGNGNQYLRSNKIAVHGASNQDKWNTLKNCTSKAALMSAMNPGNSRYFKFNLQRLNDIGTLEIRCHSASWEVVKITNWVKLMLRFVGRSIKHPPGDCLKETRGAKEQLELMFQYLIKDDSLRDYYFRRANNHRKRSQQTELFVGYGRVDQNGNRINF